METYYFMSEKRASLYLRQARLCNHFFSQQFFPTICKLFLKLF